MNIDIVTRIEICVHSFQYTNQWVTIGSLLIYCLHRLSLKTPELGIATGFVPKVLSALPLSKKVLKQKTANGG